jgi:hypothetical protein
MFVGCCNSSLFLLILQLLPFVGDPVSRSQLHFFSFSMNVFPPLFRMLKNFSILETFWLAFGISSFFVKGKSKGPLLLQFFAKFVYSSQRSFIRSFNEREKGLIWCGWIVACTLSTAVKCFQYLHWGELGRAQLCVIHPGRLHEP